MENLSCGGFVQWRICCGGVSSREFVVWEFCPVENLSCGVLSSREFVMWGFCPMENLLCVGGCPVENLSCGSFVQ